VFHINPLNAELNPICHLLALLGAHPILHVSRVRVKIGISAAVKHKKLYFLNVLKVLLYTGEIQIWSTRINFECRSKT